MSNSRHNDECLSVLELYLQTRFENRERIVVECCVIGCTGHRTTHTPNHVLVEVIVEGQRPVVNLTTIDVGTLICQG